MSNTSYVPYTGILKNVGLPERTCILHIFKKTQFRAFVKNVDARLFKGITCFSYHALNVHLLDF